MKILLNYSFIAIKFPFGIIMIILYNIAIRVIADPPRGYGRPLTNEEVSEGIDIAYTSCMKWIKTPLFK